MFHYDASIAMMTVLMSCTVSPLLVHSLPQQKKYCQRGEPCWPTADDVMSLENALEPARERFLYWKGLPNPRICAVPLFSPGEQPLFGWGAYGLKPVYNNLTFDDSDVCFTNNPEVRELCIVATRNAPYEEWMPGFVVWALDETHVQVAVRFAVKHNLCIMVVGTGHDFLNRHSCSDGVMIRTTLLKNIEWDLDDKKGFGNTDGNVRFGSGIVFHEAHKSAADNDRFIASGWAITVGITGWSIGGGHGPFGSSSGLGVDNILEVDIVTATGDLITANSKNNSDIFWALRVGGGSTWGVITALTLKAHAIPSGGFAHGIAVWIGDFCDDDMKILHQLIDTYLDWVPELNNKWSGIAFITPTLNDSVPCGGSWSWYMMYIYMGPSEEGEDTWLKFTDAVPGIYYQNGTQYANYWDFAIDYELEPISSFPFAGDGVPSVLLSRDVVASGSVAAQLKARLNDCKNLGDSKYCQRQELYNDVTGSTDSIQDPNVSIGPGFRKALFHFVFGSWNETTLDTYYALGENSYFSESHYHIAEDSWKQRYWGNNYERLLQVKQKWDPENIFWCRHCVGSDL